MAGKVTIDILVTSIEQYIFQQVLPQKNEKTAISCAKAFRQCLYINFRGQLIYVPTSDGLDQINQYKAIYADFKFNNHQELAIKYRRSLANIYSIIKKMQHEQINRHQYDLFSVSTDAEDAHDPVVLSIIKTHLPAEFIRLGLTPEESKNLSQKIASNLCQNFPGVLVFVSKKLVKSDTFDGQKSIF